MAATPPLRSLSPFCSQPQRRRLPLRLSLRVKLSLWLSQKGSWRLRLTLQQSLRQTLRVQQTLRLRQKHKLRQKRNLRLRLRLSLSLRLRLRLRQSLRVRQSPRCLSWKERPPQAATLQSVRLWLQQAPSGGLPHLAPADMHWVLNHKACFGCISVLQSLCRLQRVPPRETATPERHTPMAAPQQQYEHGKLLVGHCLPEPPRSPKYMLPCSPCMSLPHVVSPMFCITVYCPARRAPACTLLPAGWRRLLLH